MIPTPDPKAISVLYSQLLLEANDRLVNANAEASRLRSEVTRLERDNEDLRTKAKPEGKRAEAGK